MIQLIYIKHDISVDIREKFSIIPKHIEDALNKVANICDESVIISTCNRTEVYFNSHICDLSIVNAVFNCLGWDRELIKYTSHIKEDEVVRHLMEVVCGFDSIILGEDQILGQVKDAYEISTGIGTVKGDLSRLFQTAVTCGKEFRSVSGLYRVPVSSASMVVREAWKRKIKRFMILGFGEIGKLASKYIIDGKFDILYVAVRDINAVKIDNEKIRVIPFKDRKDYYEDVECIISCTSAPHPVIKSGDLPEKHLLIFDLAVPRDVDHDVYTLNNIDVFDIDKIGYIQDENSRKRKNLMNRYKYLADEYIEEFLNWQRLKDLSPYIQRIRQNGEIVYKQRSITFKNKKSTKDNEKLVDMLLKSISNTYVNKAIEVLKEEYLKGRGEECLRIIEKIFAVQE